MKISFGAWCVVFALSAASFLLSFGISEAAPRVAFVVIGMALNAFSMFSKIDHAKQ